jgi:hypothetical protein
MKKLILIVGLALAGVIHMSAQQSLPTINATTTTNVSVVTVVEPLILTPEQMTGIINLVQNSGISANVPISVTNLNRVNLMRNIDGTFTVRILIANQ